ncbi:MAG: hypothetical protein JSU94_11405 [Phycisphaerales bacterium]|nr:MAG: hypothetical protein JSU94_11405 [Phycisphaerales bacterium]
MNTRIVTAAAVILELLAAGLCAQEKDPNNSPCEKSCGQSQNLPSARQDEGTDTVETILRNLNNKTSELKSYQGTIEYKLTQPLLESTALRKGVLYYAKFGTKSRMRINFQTLRHDDEKEQKYVEHFIFDGTWLTQIDYQIKAAKRYQLAEPNEPTDAFDLASRNLPIVGFSKVEDLKKQFEIELIRQATHEPNNFIQLHLKVKPDSVHRDRYVSVDFWIDRKLGLPARVLAVSTEEDIYEIKLVRPRINKPIDPAIFDFEIPKGFGEPEIVPLKKKGR